MRFSTLPVAALTISLFALALPYGINGNDTGGIIPWSPALRTYGYREAAQDHCRGYKKVARITSVKARYGDYVGFACEFPPGYDPVGRGDWWMRPMFGIF